MSMRFLGCLLMIAAVAVLKLPHPQATGQPEEPVTEPRWEYKVVTVDTRSCDNNDGVGNLLNNNGKKGWELVGFQQTPPPGPFPQEAHGSILFRPASTGYGKEVQPNLTDSFQGTIDFKMPAVPSSNCRFVFMRQATSKR